MAVTESPEPPKVGTAIRPFWVSCFVFRVSVLGSEFRVFSRGIGLWPMMVVVLKGNARLQRAGTWQSSSHGARRVVTAHGFGLFKNEFIP